MKRLLQGYARFRREVFPEKKDHFHLLSELQAPEVLFITCADSRVVPDLILQTEPGDMFLCRTVGNVVPPHGYMPGGVSSTVEYAVEVLQVKHIIICGHSDCGAVKAVFDRRDLRRLPLTARWLGLVEPAWKFLHAEAGEDERARYVGLIHANVQAQMANLKTHPEIGRALAERRIEVHGWYYDILTGAIEAYDERARKFVPLDDVAAQP